MHGSQLLCQLWDVITCQNDNVFTGDVTALTQSQMVLIKSITKAAMFFIDETFYSDERDVTSLKNYGAGIAQWLRQQGIDTSPMQHQRMENTRMDQPSVRLGYPYVFRHLDDCEHLVVFTDARLMAPDDPQNVTDYPLVRMAPPEIIYCDACEAYPSHWIVDDPEFCPTKWTHFCKVCFGSFYYCNGKFTTRPITVHQFPQLQLPPQPASSSVPTNTSIDCAHLPWYQLISEAQFAPTPY